ncbi:hypothetical protein [Kribbella sp. CA-293567]|uniref:hypothetical protein n=1 Tax=Kribbella sp. CA-293567 TaxID=3002436 RepID=UPI0022DE5186|nr:hypothetical protein [Kribbella sp. CA-293567]WBQ04908.1 hypothetical protein OX958_33770 [Kribbella sp. CA-293567]
MTDNPTGGDAHSPIGGDADSPTHLLVIDAANVVGSRPDGWWRDRPGAARRLLTQLESLPPLLDVPTEIAVVLEGAAKAAVTSTPTDPDFPALHLILAVGSGDDAIVDFVAAASTADANRSITVITADRALRARLTPLGAETEGPNWLWTQLPT